MAVPKQTSFQGPPRQASQQCLEAGGPRTGQVQQLRLSEAAPTRHVATAVTTRARKSSRRANLRRIGGTLVLCTEGEGAMPSPSCCLWNG